MIEKLESSSSAGGGVAKEIENKVEMNMEREREKERGGVVEGGNRGKEGRRSKKCHILPPPSSLMCHRRW